MVQYGWDIKPYPPDIERGLKVRQVSMLHIWIANQYPPDLEICLKVRQVSMSHIWMANPYPPDLEICVYALHSPLYALL
jgi:hypothetical protein